MKTRVIYKMWGDSCHAVCWREADVPTASSPFLRTSELQQCHIYRIYNRPVTDLRIKTRLELQ